MGEENKKVTTKEKEKTNGKKVVVGVKTTKNKGGEDIKKGDEKVKEVKEVKQDVEEPKKEVKKPTFKLSSSKDYIRYIKMMLYGDFGVGKTTLAGSSANVPEMRGVLNIDAEGGDKVLEDMNIDTVQVRTYKQLSDVYEYLRAHCYLRDSNDIERLRAQEEYYRGVKVKQPKKYNTVMIDSLTEVQKYLMYQLMGIDSKNWSLATPPPMPEYKEWNQNHEMIRKLIREFRNLPMHVIFVCQRDIEISETKERYYRPQMPGKLANEIQGFLDHVGYYTAHKADNGEIVRQLSLQPGKTYQAKNRFKDFHDIGLVNPTMKDIYNLEINKEKE